MCNDKIVPPENVQQWLKDYDGNNGFVSSVKGQFTKSGKLSPKQIKCIADNMGIAEKNNGPSGIEPTFFAGEVVNISRGLARKFAKEHNLDVFFTNLEIVEVVKETRFRLITKIKFHSKISSKCHVCNASLDDPISVATGIGPVCAGHLGFKRPKIDATQEILERIEEYANTVGEITIDLPKDWIRRVENHVDDDVPF